MDTEFWTDHLKHVFDSYELCFTKERAKKYEAADGDLLSKEVKEEEGISLRGIKGGKMVFSYTYEQGEKAAAALVENARTLMPFLDEDPFYAFPDRAAAYPSLDLWDERGLKLDDDSKVKALINMESIIRGFDARITTTRNCELHESEIEIGMINSNGLETRAAKTVYALSGMAVAAQKGEEVSWYDWAWSAHYKALAPPALGKGIAEKAVSFLSGQVLDTGAYTGLLTPACGCQILEILSPSFLAENLYKNKTRLKEKAGQKLFSELLTVVDSGTRGIGAFAFDGEGVPSRENIVVRQGVFEGFLYDTYYGNVLKNASTGNGVRSGIKEPPRCATRGFYIDAGQGGASTNELGNGIVIEELMGTHMANSVTGDFSLGAIGHYYSGGKRTPFKGVIFSGNLFDVLSNVRAVGDDLTFYGAYGSPSLLIEGLKISGK
jgi:PmbA protein